MCNNGAIFQSVVLHFRCISESKNGDTIPNHGYLMISDIGTSDDTALICHTNRPPVDSKPHSGGHWFAPDGTPVDFDVPGFSTNRSPMMLRLLRNTSTGTPSEGIYECLIEDDTFTVQTVYVGLYSGRGGTYTIMCIIIWSILFV